jgi:hypothetical protein
MELGVGTRRVHEGKATDRELNRIGRNRTVRAGVWKPTKVPEV